MGSTFLCQVSGLHWCPINSRRGLLLSIKLRKVCYSGLPNVLALDAEMIVRRISSPGHDETHRPLLQILRN